MAEESYGFLSRFRTKISSGGLHGAYRAVFDSPAGRIVLNDLFIEGNMMRSHGGDPVEEGKRELVCHICRILRMDPEQFQSLAERESRDE